MSPPSAAMGPGPPPSPSPPLGRPPFRRQGSSYGTSRVHHMALMVSPQQRVDYSVNKDGLRSWAVLIVFVLLCSAILNIFSEDDFEPEKGELLPAEHDHPEADDADADAELIEVETPKMDEDADAEEAEQEEEEDEDDAEESKEERMLARLREAAAEAEKRRRAAEAERRQKVAEERRRRERERERKEAERAREAEEEEEEEETGEAEEEKTKDQKEEEEEDREADQPDQDHQVQPSKHHQAVKKKHHARSWRDSQLQAKMEDTKKPRKNLLKHRKREEPKMEEPEVEEEEEEEPLEEAEGEEEEEAPLPINEVAALKKRTVYNRKALTNRRDYKHRTVLDAADFALEKHDFSTAMAQYGQILAKNKDSPRALSGRGRLYQLRAEFAEEHENPEEFLEKALSDYTAVLENEDTPDELFRMTAQHLVDSARFLGGHQHKILQVQRALVDCFPEDLDFQCDLGATWLGMDRPTEAAQVFRNVLDSDPGHPLALAYLGYIHKVHEGELEQGVHALRRAMRAGDARVQRDAKFYFHLGDGLTRMGRTREALQVYAEGVRHGLFPSVLQRSLHNLQGLQARPWWTVEQSECAKPLRALERQWTAIREEALRIWEKRPQWFGQEPLELASGSAGGEFSLILRSNALGGFGEEICARWMPSTCELLKPIAEAICAKDKFKLSILLPGTHTWPHCGQSNYVLEAQLGLVTPSEARLRVGQEARGWRPGRLLMFDTSFEQEISFEGASPSALRMALVIELWHPEVPKELRGKIRADGDDP